MTTPTIPTYGSSEDWRRQRPAERAACPRALKLCLFRTCEWSITADAPAEVLEELIARHLLAGHRDELVALGRLAEHGELL